MFQERSDRWPGDWVKALSYSVSENVEPSALALDPITDGQ
jgi:hypothetical protein